MARREYGLSTKKDQTDEEREIQELEIEKLTISDLDITVTPFDGTNHPQELFSTIRRVGKIRGWSEASMTELARILTTDSAKHFVDLNPYLKTTNDFAQYSFRLEQAYECGLISIYPHLSDPKDAVVVMGFTEEERLLFDITDDSFFNSPPPGSNLSPSRRHLGCL